MHYSRENFVIRPADIDLQEIVERKERFCRLNSSIMSLNSIYSTPFDELKDPRRVWKGKPGSHEEGMGKLSLLTPELVAKAAASEIKTGQRVTLGWELTKLEKANLNRQPCKHDIIWVAEGVAFDDVYTFNPQQSSQWDGLRHFSQRASNEKSTTEKQDRVFYGGTTIPEVQDRSNDRIGIHHWAREGIAGRGVLIDYVAYAEKNNIKYTTFSTHQVKLSDIKAIAKDCNITFQKGDLLFVRVGVTKEWESWSDEQKEAYATNPKPEHAGVEATTDVLRFLWDEGFSAIASDAISWEVYPAQGDLFMHEYLLAGWGVPIGMIPSFQ